MANKLSITDKIFLIILLCGLLAISSCASADPREDSNHYVVQTQSQTYPCSECGYQIPMENISSNIRVKNKCPSCQKIFFGVPVVNKSQEGEKVASYGLRSHGPRSIYESDTNYQHFWVGGESFKETETGYSFLYWRFRDSKVKSRRVIPHWTTRRYGY